MKINKNLKSTLLVIGIVLVTLVVWFGAEKAFLFAKLNTPFPKQWMGVQLANGEILYGHFAGEVGGIYALKDVFTLETISPILPSGEVTAGEGYLVSGALAGDSTKKIVPLPKTELLFLPRESVVYLKFVDQSDPAYPYLQ